MPAVDTAAIQKRANDSVGFNIDAKTKGWQTTLDKIEDALRKPNPTYSTLNSYRDDLLALRTDGEEFRTKLEPRLSAIEDEVGKLLVLAQDQPPESEQAAQLRADLNYHLGLLKSAQSSLGAADLRIDQQLNTIQDIRRKLFTNSLFQPVPGVYSAKTWEHASDYASLAAARVENVVTEWWSSVRDQNHLTHLAAVAIGLCFALIVLASRGVGMLRAWNEAGAPPFWKRASSAAGAICSGRRPRSRQRFFSTMQSISPRPSPNKWVGSSMPDPTR